ncbi:MAG: rhamnulose-1-phosphate aldolase [Anaerostipes sp.]|nr:rhamnulose-1-phosphate aldolase [Anaerostipes sp.]
MTDILKTPFLEETIESCRYFWEAGWGENHAGNLTYLLSEEEVNKYVKDVEKAKKGKPVRVAMTFEAKELIGKYFLVTRAGSFFRTIHKHPEKDLGIVKVNHDSIDIIWGFDNGRMKPTSEFPAHLLCHQARLKQNPDNKLVMHCHPTNVIAMTFAHEINEEKFTKTMWRLNSECVLVFPEGLGMLPWMVCGEGPIGPDTAKKMEKYRIVIWPYHGMFASGTSFEDTIGLIETVEKNAQVYMLNGGEIKAGLTDAQVRELAQAFDLWD